MPPEPSNQSLIHIDGFSFFYGENQALFDIDLHIPKKQVTALIGPSGCGKSTLLRSINRMNDLIEESRYAGDIKIEGESIFDPKVEVISLRKRIGMVFQKSNPFPKSIFENVVFGLRINGQNDKRLLEEKVEKSLKAAALWDEVKDRLDENALGLSGGQMQRLCIARAIAIQPDILLMDEPCSALDPVATAKIESLIQKLKNNYTIVIVTHNMQQAARVSDQTAFLYMGSLVEYDETEKLFTNPVQKKTEDYITGRFG